MSDTSPAVVPQCRDCGEAINAGDSRDSLCLKCYLADCIDDTMAADDDDDDGDFAEEECGRWYNGKLGRQCTKAGSEECDWICPIGPWRRRR
jgi:hypothetical protein